MKAIPTLYRGVTFRSRLEARWAVLFDAVGAPWVYEREAFALPSGNYLPDFYLPDAKRWVEIKPPDPTPLAEALCLELAAATGERVTMCAGDLTTWRMRLRHWSPGQQMVDRVLEDLGPGAHAYDERFVPCVCSECGLLDFTYPGDRGESPCKATGRPFHMRVEPVVEAIRTVLGHRFWEPVEAR